MCDVFRNRLFIVSLSLVCSLFAAMPAAHAGSALHFNGSSAYVEVAGNSDSLLTITNAITASAWCYMDAWNEGMQIVGKGDRAYSLRRDANNQRLAFKLRDATRDITPNNVAGATTAWGLYSNNLSLGQWYHVAGTWDGATARIYIDGELHNEVATLAGPVGRDQVVIDPVHIGCNWSGTERRRFWNGRIDEVRLWNVALSQEQIQSQMDREIGGFEDGLVGYWNFNEGSGDTANDSSGNGNHGTIVNATWTADAAPISPLGAAYDPSPANGSEDVVDGLLSWAPPLFVDAPTYTVAFGTDPNALDVVAEALTEPVHDAGVLGDGLDFSETYYWQVTVENNGLDSFWSFTTADPVIINSVSGDAQPLGGTGQVSVDAVSPVGAELSYQWYRLNFELFPGFVVPEVEVPGATSAVYEIQDLKIADEGEYYVVVSSVDGAAASEVVFLDVQVGLIHRYSFGDSPDGVVLPDSAGGADATLVNLTGQAAIADGQVVLGNDGSQSSNGGGEGLANGDYVDLPNGLVGNLTQMTIEVWTTWNDDNQSWQRVYDFGSSTQGEGLSGTALDSFFFAPRRGNQHGGLEYRAATATLLRQPTSDGKLPLGEEILITQVHDDKAGRVKLYINGIAVGGYAAPFPLKDMTDVNNWLGRSQGGNPLYVGSYNELRIYDTVVSAEQIAANYLAGPDQLGELPALSEGPRLIGDLNQDGVYDFLDVAIAADQFLNQRMDRDETIAAQ